MQVVQGVVGHRRRASHAQYLLKTTLGRPQSAGVFMSLDFPDTQPLSWYESSASNRRRWRWLVCFQLPGERLHGHLLIQTGTFLFSTTSNQNVSFSKESRCQQEVLALGWSASDFLASGSMDGNVRLWQLSRADCLRVFKCAPASLSQSGARTGTACGACVVVSTAIWL